MKIIAFFSTAFLLVLLISCKKESNSRTVTTSTATLDYKECVYFEQDSITVCFMDANEYRCPCNADCIWAGACDVTLKITTPAKDSTVTLSWSPDGSGIFADSIMIDSGRVVRVTKIEPEDCNKYEIYADYKATVEAVSK